MSACRTGRIPTGIYNAFGEGGSYCLPIKCMPCGSLVGRMRGQVPLPEELGRSRR